MRRISIHRPNAKVRNPGRHIRALRRSADEFDGYYPLEPEYWSRARWKIPVLDRLVSPPTTTLEIQRQCAQCLVDAATHLVRAKPPELSHTLVSLAITWPDMFGSDFLVAFEPKPYREQPDRDPYWYKRTEFTTPRSLARELGLQVPDFFKEQGWTEIVRQDVDIDPIEGEVWNFYESWFDDLRDTGKSSGERVIWQFQQH